MHGLPAPLVLREQSTQAQVIDHVLNLLDAVLDTITPLSQCIVLEIEYLEAGMDVLDKLSNLQRSSVVAERH